VARFSVNLPPSESSLARLPEEQISALFGSESVLPVSRSGNLLDALRDHWNQPLELLPFLLVLILFILAVESLLANKFYRRDPEAPQEPAKAEGEQT
jgi:hypothetical protein